MNRKCNVEVLDCTLRDGGLGLEDALKNNIADAGFSIDDRIEIERNLTKAEIDIIELGSIEITDDDKTRFAIYKSIEDISRMIPAYANEEIMYAALYRGPDTAIEDIPEWRSGLCKVVRVILRYSELQKSLDFCTALSKKGYKVFVQPMLTMRYTDEELERIIYASNKMHAYAVYIVDSYGYMNSDDILRLYTILNGGLNPGIRIGFHAHNNMNLAFSNVLEFLKISESRNIVVDSCICGMGQGAGNLQTEIITDYINKNYNIKYNYNAVLETCEIIDKYNTSNLWGYSVIRLLAAINKTAYKYAVALRNKYKLNYIQINNVLKNIPEGLRHRYTLENVKKLLKDND